MKHSILIIEKETETAQEISSALKSIDAEIVVADDRSAIPKILKSHKIDLIICNHRFSGLDCFALCRNFKEQSAPNVVGFMLLCPRQEVSKIVTKAEEALVDNIIHKPVEPEQIKSITLKLLDTIKEARFESQRLLVYIENSLTRAIVQRVLELRSSEIVLCETSYEAILSCKQQTVGATITDATSFEWYKEKHMGHLVVILPETFNKDEERRPQDLPTKNTLCLLRPLTYADITAMLDEHLGSAPPRRADEFNISLDPGEHALLAARVSAAVYECLLMQAGLKNGNWNEAARSARDEILKTCKTFEGLIRRRDSA